MSPVRLIATKAYTYAGRSLKVGDLFEAPEKDAKLLTLIGNATEQPSTYLAKVVQPSDENHSEVATPKPKRQYRRRDLVPEA